MLFSRQENEWPSYEHSVSEVNLSYYINKKLWMKIKYKKTNVNCFYRLELVFSMLLTKIPMPQRQVRVFKTVSFQRSLRFFFLFKSARQSPL
jgi:hypothetical protein